MRATIFVDRAKSNFTSPTPPRIKCISSLTGSARAAVGQPVAPNVHDAAFHVHAQPTIFYVARCLLDY